MTARFLSQDDPKYSKNNDPLSLNLYTYCSNNPIKYNDPSGHKLAAVADGVKGYTKSSKQNKSSKNNEEKNNASKQTSNTKNISTVDRAGNIGCVNTSPSTLKSSKLTYKITDNSLKDKEEKKTYLIYDGDMLTYVYAEKDSLLYNIKEPTMLQITNNPKEFKAGTLGNIAKKIVDFDFGFGDGYTAGVKYGPVKAKIGGGVYFVQGVEDGEPCAYAQMSGEATIEYKDIIGLTTSYTAKRNYTDMPPNASSAWDSIAVDPDSKITVQPPCFYIGNLTLSNDGVSFNKVKNVGTKDDLVEIDLPFMFISANLDGQALLDAYNYTFVPSSRNEYIYVIPEGYEFTPPTPCPAPINKK